MMNTPTKPFVPGRLFLPGCAVAAGLLTVVTPRTVHAAPALAAPAPRAVRLNLTIGHTATLPLPARASYHIETGANLVLVEADDESVSLKAVEPGEVKVRIDFANGASAWTVFNVAEPSISLEAYSRGAYFENRANAQLAATAAQTAGAAGAAPAVAATGTAAAGNLGLPPVEAPAIPPPTGGPPPPGAPMAGSPTTSSPTAPNPTTGATAPGSAVTTSTSAMPAVTVAAPAPIETAPETMPPAPAPQVSPPVAAPSYSAPAAAVKYHTTPRLPSHLAPTSRQTLQVTQGLARLLRFPRNILAVFFSDPGVMDARAINARTIAVTGLGGGSSTLAVFTEQYPGDAIGQANIFRVEVQGRVGAQVSSVVDDRNIGEVTQAITAAINDSRIHVQVFRDRQDSSLIARLTGGVKDQREIDGAVATATFFVPRVVSGLYTDNLVAPYGTDEGAGISPLLGSSDLQSSLRTITGNDTIELQELPNNALAFKAEVGSVEEAESLQRLLPTLNREVIPFIVIHGEEGARNPGNGVVIPHLMGEDRQLTDKLQSATGIYTVYAIRASGSSIALYGNVLDREAYERVNRWALVAAQLATPAPVQNTNQGGAPERPSGTEAALAAYNPAGGYQSALGVQNFVHVLEGMSVKKVTVQTEVVEINRTAAHNLGIRFGSATTLTSTTTLQSQGLPTTTIVPQFGPGGVNANPLVLSTPGAITPGSVTATINPTLTPGIISFGNGFIGTNGTAFSPVDPFRFQLNALYQDGQARLLSSPNLTAIEGMPAQIVIGGARPVPQVTSTNTGTSTSIGFRNYGVILTMRPTVTADNTIILQIRAEVTALDGTTSIVVSGATIPGETTRSVDTTINIHEGDTIVMGGLMTNEHNLQTTKIPFLGDLPVIGSLFRSRSFQNNQSELSIFMTPHLETTDISEESYQEMIRAQSYPGLPSSDAANNQILSTSPR